MKRRGGVKRRESLRMDKEERNVKRWTENVVFIQSEVEG